MDSLTIYVFMQESAEEEQSLAAHRIRNDQRKNMPVITSHSADSAHSVHGVTVTAGSSDVKSTSATASSAMCLSLSNFKFVSEYRLEREYLPMHDSQYKLSVVVACS